jgi:hypothetical protein
MRHAQFISSLLCVSLVGLAGGCSSPADDPMDGMADTDGDDTADGSDTSDPSSGDPSSGDPSGGDPSGGDPTGGDPTGGDPSGGSTGDEPVDEDLEPPTILSVSPADGETGVAADAPIVITFSEPMDKAATQVAYQSTDISPAAVTMSWNDAGDELTIVPNDPFEYAEGLSTDIDTLEPLSYAFTIGQAARDKAGNELESELPVEFSTYRRLLHLEYMMGSMTARLRGSGGFILGTLLAGDDQDGDYYWGVTSVALYDLPAGIEVFEEVVFNADQDEAVPDPFEGLGLGNLHVYDVAYSDIGTAEDAPMLTDLGTLSTDAAAGWRELDVTAAVAEDYEAAEDLTQFALRFETETDTDGISEFAQFETDGGLLFTFLIP